MDNVAATTLTLYPYPSLAITKSPQEQIIGLNGDAVFTLLVTNNGNTDLENIQVTDPLAPACDITIPTLLQSQSTTYTCQMNTILS